MMNITADVFAEMLGITPGELVWAVKSGNILNGMTLPRSARKGKNNALMFQLEDVIKFVEEYNRSK